MNNPEHTQIALFKGKQIRKMLHGNEWWFSVVDVCEVLTDSVNARDYWFKMKIMVKDEACVELSIFCRQLKLPAQDGKMRETDCANTEGIFRIIQSIPSLKAEPFKRWLAKVGYERVQEIENPELATKRTRMLYKLKGDVWRHTERIQETQRLETPESPRPHGRFRAYLHHARRAFNDRTSHHQEFKVVTRSQRRCKDRWECRGCCKKGTGKATWATNRV